MGPPPLLPLDDEGEYKKMRGAVGKSVPADFFSQFWGRMFTDTAWDVQRFRGVATDLIKAELEQVGGATANSKTDLALVVSGRLDTLERLYRLIAGREHRADAIYHLLQRHVANMGSLLPTTEPAEDAEFCEVDDKAGEESPLSPHEPPEDEL